MRDLRGYVVLVTPRSFGVAAPHLRAELEAAVGVVRYNERGRPLRADELRELIGDVDGLLAGLDEIDRSVLAAAPRLRVVARYGVGTDNVDLAAASERGIIVTNTPTANTDAVAELTIGFMVALARALPRALHELREGRWTAPQGIEIAGKTLGLIGFGRIGQAVARRALALGCRVIAYDPYVTAPGVALRDVQMVSLDAVLAEAQFVSLHVPVSSDTRDLVDASFIGRMQEGAYLINTARGELIVEDDVLRALERGYLRGAALDALRAEPAVADHPLLQRADVLVTPHIGANTVEATVAMGRTAMNDLLAVLSGAAPRFPVAPPARTTTTGGTENR